MGTPLSWTSRPLTTPGSLRRATRSLPVGALGKFPFCYETETAIHHDLQTQFFVDGVLHATLPCGGLGVCLRFRLRRSLVQQSSSQGAVCAP